MLSLSAITQDSILIHAIRQWKLTPKMHAQDAYKWLYQAAMGGEHAITSQEGPRRSLEDEWKTLDPPSKGEALIVELTPDGSVLRVNLRPYKAGGGNKEALLRAFIDSARRFKPDFELFRKQWSALGRIGPIGHIDPISIRLFDRQARASGYPALRHSPEYVTAYKPAYRVLTKEQWTKLSA